MIRIAGAKVKTVSIKIILSTDTKSEGFWLCGNDKLSEGKDIPDVPGTYPPRPASALAENANRQKINPIVPIRIVKRFKLMSLIVTSFPQVYF